MAVPKFDVASIPAPEPDWLSRAVAWPLYSWSTSNSVVEFWMEVVTVAKLLIPRRRSSPLPAIAWAGPIAAFAARAATPPSEAARIARRDWGTFGSIAIGLGLQGCGFLIGCGRDPPER